MGPIDEFELDVLERTGDVALAEQVGDTVRSIVASAAEDFSAVLGIPSETLLPMVERSLLFCEAFCVESAVIEVDDDG